MTYQTDLVLDVPDGLDPGVVELEGGERPHRLDLEQVAAGGWRKTSSTCLALSVYSQVN